MAAKAVLTICLTSLFTIKCWLLQNKVIKLKAVYQKLWTWGWKHNSTHQIGGGNRSVTWTFAEIRQYAAADCHNFEDGHEFKFMSNVHEDISVDENCVKTQIPIQKLSRLSRLNLQICKVQYIKFRQTKELV